MNYQSFKQEKVVKKRIALLLNLLMACSTIAMEEVPMEEQQNDISIAMSEEHAISLFELELKQACRVQDAAQLSALIKNKITALQSLPDAQVLQRLRALDRDACRQLKNILIGDQHGDAAPVSLLVQGFGLDKVAGNEQEVRRSKCCTNRTLARWRDNCGCEVSDILIGSVFSLVFAGIFLVALFTK